jgi:crotonobetainyl-CoA:carnitine CoA-transferase CaiB-like acyl-CoA transferase
VNPAQPLAGVRVLDLCVVFSGTAATMLLGDLGAEVIKVESRGVYSVATKGPRRLSARSVDRLDNLTRGYADREPGDRPWDRWAPSAVHGRNKRSMTVDLTRPEGRAVFLDLVARSDALLENNKAGLLEKLGLGWDVLHARNPRLVLVRMPPLALDGEAAALSGLGSNFEAMTGALAFRGYRDLPPATRPVSYRMDAATGPMAAFATVAALRDARRTGSGRLVVLPQAVTLMHHFADQLVAAQRGGPRAIRPGNRHPRMAPHGCYPVRGGGNGEAWIAVACRDDADWGACARVLGSPPALQRYRALTDRKADEDALDDAIAGLTRHLDGATLEGRLTAAGVPAALVRTEGMKLADPQLRARGFFHRVEHPVVGERTFPGHLWRTSAGPLRFDRAAPTLGQDNDYVYREVLGYDDEQIRTLTETGHIGERYTFEDPLPVESP